MTIFQKQKTIFKALTNSSKLNEDLAEESDDLIDSRMLEIEEATADFLDESGKTIRWRRTIDF